MLKNPLGWVVEVAFMMETSPCTHSLLSSNSTQCMNQAWSPSVSLSFPAPCPCVSLAWPPLCPAGDLLLAHLLGSFVFRGQSCTVCGCKSENTSLEYLFTFWLKGKHSIVTWSEPGFQLFPHSEKRWILAWPLPSAKST